MKNTYAYTTFKHLQTAKKQLYTLQKINILVDIRDTLPFPNFYIPFTSIAFQAE